MDTSVATLPFRVLTVKLLEQFPYTVSYGSRRYNSCIQRGETSIGALGEPGKGSWEKGWEPCGFGRTSPSTPRTERGPCRRLGCHRWGEHQGRVVLTELSTQAGPPGPRWTLTSCPELSERFPAAHLRHVFHSPSRDVCLGSPPRSRERPEARPLQDAALYSPSTCGPLHGLENGRGTQAN